MEPAERLIVAADFKPADGMPWQSVRNLCRTFVLDLAKKLSGTGIVIKVNSALRVCGYELIEAIHDVGCAVFADLKLFDISETLKNDGGFLDGLKPEILTVSAFSGDDSIRRLKSVLPNTEILGVSVLTSLTTPEMVKMFWRPDIETAVVHFSNSALLAGCDGVICAPREARAVRTQIGRRTKMIVTPGIRPEWAVVKGDDQDKARVMAVVDAIRVGADRIVVGRPITRADNPYDAAMRTIEEITKAVEAREKAAA